MARSKIEDCPICSDSELNTRAWHQLQDNKGDYEKAAAAFYTIDRNLLRDHFQYHKATQPPPKGSLRRDKALEKGKKLTQRAQDMILLTSRVPALSATQLAEIFFWNGTAKQMSSARNACYRQLRNLMYTDMLYRIYPGPTARPAALEGGKGESVSIYFLGRDGVPLVESREGQQLTRRQWVVRPEDAGEDWKLRQRQEANEVVTGLNRQLKEDNRIEIQGVEAEISFSYLNWIADRRMFWQWQDAVRGPTRIYLSGLAAIGATFPERNASFLLPFTYLYDAGSQSVESTVNELTHYGLLERSDLIHNLLPEMPVGFVPPLLVICRDAERVAAVRAAAQKNSLTYTNKPLIITTDQTTFENHGLRGESWISLWDGDKSPARHRLLTVLLQGIKGKVALDGDHVIKIEGKTSN